MIWTSTLQIRKHDYSGDLNFIILFVVGILPLYAINFDVVCLFANSSFTFLARLNMWLYLMYSINWINEYHFIFVNKKKVEYINRDPYIFKFAKSWKWWICEQVHNIRVNIIKQLDVYKCENAYNWFDKIQMSGIVMLSDLQRWRR
jgi:hypothetical protein